jgi:hypothetical protein
MRFCRRPQWGERRLAEALKPLTSFVLFELIGVAQLFNPLLNPFVDRRRPVGNRHRHQRNTRNRGKGQQVFHNGRIHEFKPRSWPVAFLTQPNQSSVYCAAGRLLAPQTESGYFARRWGFLVNLSSGVLGLPVLPWSRVHPAPLWLDSAIFAPGEPIRSSSNDTGKVFVDMEGMSKKLK